MNEAELETLKIRVGKVGRKKVAIALGMPYGTLSVKLNGYVPLTEEEKARIEDVLVEVSAVK